MVKIGVVGLGKMGMSHFAIVNSHPGAEVSVCDSSRLVLDVIGRYTGVPVLPRLRRDAGEAGSTR